jgi:hypothetical protein
LLEQNIPTGAQCASGSQLRLRAGHPSDGWDETFQHREIFRLRRQCGDSIATPRTHTDCEKFMVLAAKGARFALEQFVSLNAL